MLFLARSSGNKADFKKWCEDLPAFSIFIIGCTITTTAYSMIKPFSMIIFTLIPSITFKLHLFFQLFTFPYVCLDQISCLFSLIAYMPYCTSKEKSQGSFKTFINFTIQNTIIGLLFWVFSNLILILGGNPINYFFMILFGLWPSIMYEIVLESNRNGEDLVSFVFLSFTFKRKWYPLIFLVFYSMLGAFYDLLVGLMLGYMGEI